MQQTEVIIVGAGPIGLELAAALRHGGVDYLHFEAGQIGQTMAWYPRQMRFFSSPPRIAIAGVPLQTADQEKATGEQYLAYLRSVVEQFDLQVNTYQRVTAIERDEGQQLFTVGTSRNQVEQTYQARHVVLAIGDMHQPRRLGIEGEELGHVSHYFVEPHRYFRQRLLIVGGKNSAVEAAMRCCRAGANVALSYRRDDFQAKSVKYWLLPELKSMIKAGEITFYPATVLVKIAVGEVELASVTGDGESIRVPADFVLLLVGYEMDMALLEMAGVELAGDNRAPVLDKKTMMTGVPGLYVAGTAAAGTQSNFRLFIENCHVHVVRIVKSITGCDVPAHLINDTAKLYGLPES